MSLTRLRVTKVAKSSHVFSMPMTHIDLQLFDRRTQEVHTAVLTQDLASAAAGPGSYLHLLGQVNS
jgi:hypothetical protein